MIIKEKLIFWPLVAIFIGILVFWFVSQGEKEETTRHLLKEIERATQKSMAKKKEVIDKWNIDRIKQTHSAQQYSLLLERSPFFRFREDSDIPVEEKKPTPVKKEEPKKVVFKYKGQVMMGERVMVVIENQGTGKSHFVEEGDAVGDYLVASIDEKKVVLKKKGGEEIILSVVKKKPGEETQQQ